MPSPIPSRGTARSVTDYVATADVSSRAATPTVALRPPAACCHAPVAAGGRAALAGRCPADLVVGPDGDRGPDRTGPDAGCSGTERPSAGGGAASAARALLAKLRKATAEPARTGRNRTRSYSHLMAGSRAAQRCVDRVEGAMSG